MTIRNSTFRRPVIAMECGQVSSVNVTSGGSGYSASNPPTAGFGAPGTAGGTTATGTGVVGGVPRSARTIIFSPHYGSGYVVPPTVTFDAPPAGGTAPTAVARVDPVAGKVTAVQILTGGSGYTAASINMYFNGTVVTGTTVPTSPGAVTDVTITSAGGGYLSAPSVGFSGGGGTMAAGTGVLTAGYPPLSTSPAHLRMEDVVSGYAATTLLPAACAQLSTNTRVEIVPGGTTGAVVSTVVGRDGYSRFDWAAFQRNVTNYWRMGEFGITVADYGTNALATATKVFPMTQNQQNIVLSDGIGGYNARAPGSTTPTGSLQFSGTASSLGILAQDGSDWSASGCAIRNVVGALQVIYGNWSGTGGLRIYFDTDDKLKVLVQNNQGTPIVLSGTTVFNVANAPIYFMVQLSLSGGQLLIYTNGSTTPEASLTLPSTLFDSDTFTDTAGTSLVSHVPNVGGSWAANGAVPGGAAVITAAPGNTVRANVNADSVFYCNGAPLGADYDVQADAILKSAVGSVGVTGRQATGARTYYLFDYEFSTQQWRLSTLLNGSVVGTPVTLTETLTAGNTYTMKLSIRGTTISGYVNGVLKCQMTDANISAAGKAGLFFNPGTAPSDTVSWQVDNFSATSPVYTDSGQSPVIGRGMGSPPPFDNDTFTDAAGTSIFVHMPNMGGPWAANGAFPASAAVITASPGNTLRANANTDCVFYLSGTPASPDYDVQVDAVPKSAAGSVGVIGREATGVETYYLFDYEFGSQQWHLYAVLNGTIVASTASSVETLTVGNTYTMKLSMRTSGGITTVTGYVNGVQKCQMTDNHIPSAGKAGLYLNPQIAPLDTVSWQADNFSATGVGEGVADLQIGRLGTWNRLLSGTDSQALSRRDHLIANPCSSPQPSPVPMGEVRQRRGGGSAPT